MKLCVTFSYPDQTEALYKISFPSNLFLLNIKIEYTFVKLSKYKQMKIEIENH